MGELITRIKVVFAQLWADIQSAVSTADPGEKILSCIRRSKQLMKDKKKDLFFLLVSFLLWYLLEMLIASMLAGVLSTVFQMLAGLALSVYAGCSVAAFYLFLSSGEKTVPEPDPEELN